MSKKVELLPAHVVNQIAAGEVLENPASAVKELVENSIDAGSSQIEVEIKGGGHHLIRVEDDGVGMCGADAVDCFERHATSKIRHTDDLLKLATMGFRGEALAAIASVSEVELETSDGVEVSVVRVEAGAVRSCGIAARNRGTTIDVRSLFYNVPARQKFQKSASSSGAQVLRVIQTLALAHPEVAFSLTSQDREVFRTERRFDWRERVKEVLGEFAHEVKHRAGEYFVYGLIGSPEEAKGTRSCQHVFLNKRPVFSPVISRAIKEGYSTRVSEGRYPPAILFLELPPDEFDVNVHPQKKDVRFRDESKVFRLVERAISEGFGMGASSGFTAPLHFQEAPLPWDVASFSRPLVSMEEEQRPLFEVAALKARPIALLGSFALFEKGGWLIVDLKGAEARILYENMQKAAPDVQPLLIPLEISLSRQESLQAEEWIEDLKSMGIEARRLGEKIVVIDALPIGIEARDAANFFGEWKADRKLAASICRYVRSRKKIYNVDLAGQIYEKLAECKDSLYDPLGRLIYREIQEEQMETWLVQ